MKKICKQCEQEFEKVPSDSVSYFMNRRMFCSKRCADIAAKGKRNSPDTELKSLPGSSNPQWKGGRYLTTQGYVSIWVGLHKRQLEHRYVMEKHLGRKLTRSDHVHHLNGDKQDNRLENLELVGIKEHGTRHAMQRWHGINPSQGAF